MFQLINNFVYPLSFNSKEVTEKQSQKAFLLMTICLVINR